VRYVVHAASDATTHLEILAVFVEDGTNRLHPSNSTVETSEFSEIQRQLTSIQRDRQLAAETREKKDREVEEAAALAKQNRDEAARYQDAESSLKTLNSAPMSYSMLLKYACRTQTRS